MINVNFIVKYVKHVRQLKFTDPLSGTHVYTRGRAGAGDRTLSSVQLWGPSMRTRSSSRHYVILFYLLRIGRPSNYTRIHTLLISRTLPQNKGMALYRRLGECWLHKNLLRIIILYLKINKFKTLSFIAPMKLTLR